MSRIVVYSVQEDELRSAHLAQALETEGFRTALLDVRDAHFAPDPDSPIIIYWSDRTVLSPARAQLAELIGNVGEQPLCLVTEESLDLPSSLAHLVQFPLPFERESGEVDRNALSPITRFLRGEAQDRAHEPALAQNAIATPDANPPEALPETGHSIAREDAGVGIAHYDTNAVTRPFYATPLHGVVSETTLKNNSHINSKGPEPMRPDPVGQATGRGAVSTNAADNEDQPVSERVTALKSSEHRPSRIYPLLRGIAALLAIVAGLAIMLQMLGPQLPKPEGTQALNSDRQIIQVAESTGSRLETQSNPLSTDSPTTLAPTELVPTGLVPAEANALDANAARAEDKRVELASNAADPAAISAAQNPEPAITQTPQSVAILTAASGSSQPRATDPSRPGITSRPKAGTRSPTETRYAAATDLAGVESLWTLRDAATAKLVLVDADLRNSQFGSPGFDLFLARRGALVQHLAEIDDALLRSTSSIGAGADLR